MVVLMTGKSFRRALFILLLCGPIAAGAWPLPAPAQGDKQVIDITAERFSFTPSEIRVPAGTTLEIRLRSDDTAHGFRILGTDVDIELPKRGRGMASVTFTPPEAGRYTFECSRVCGAGHAFMRGVIVVSDSK
jgi:cytochrome c oxidase subunit 2